MKLVPEDAEFQKLYDSGTAQLVWTERAADLDTPVSIVKRLGENRPYSILLESVKGGNVRDRYSIIALQPDLIWKSRGDQYQINRQALHSLDTFSEPRSGTMESLKALVDESAIAFPDDMPAPASGLFGFFSYDFVRLIEKLPDTNPADPDTPDTVLMRPTVVIIIDNIVDRMKIITPVRPQEGVTASQSRALAHDRLRAIVECLAKAPHVGADAQSAPAVPMSVDALMTADEYGAMVRKAKEYIASGDIFQVVLSQRFVVDFPRSSFDLYRTLRRLNPSPFLFHLNLDGFSLIGSSPEILVRLRDENVTIRPLAGTRPRGANRAEDLAHAEDLLADPKECAEHLMLLDLGRNDVGRVSEVGSVSVTEQMQIEYYSHVMHIVSNVEGKIDRKRADVVDTLCAGFPAGTVSGAPKVRAMEIIDELEPLRRGFYAGSVGYIGADGDLDCCINLRTAMVADNKLYIQSGAGIVADSHPEAEHNECIFKAKALLRAAELTLSDEA